MVSVAPATTDIVVNQGLDPMPNEAPLHPNGYLVKQRYQLIRPIGTGAMGAVHEAVEVNLGKRVAVKFLDPILARDQRVSARFRREARAAAQVHHDNVCDVSDLGVTDEGIPYLVMELLDGEPFSEVLRREGKLSVGRAVGLMGQVLSALAAAHALGIVHRDLKPANIFLTRASDGSERVKLIDFGIAKVTQASDSVEATTAGMIMGTPYFMSPEQAAGETKEVDQRTDVWAVGVILYLSLTGTVPFAGENHLAVFNKVFHQEPPPPRELEPSIPTAVEAAILQALCKERGGRYATADELKAVLDRATGQDHVPTRPAGVPKVANISAPADGKNASLTPTEMSVAASRRKRWMVPGIVAVLLLLVGVGSGAFVVLSGRSEATPPAPGTPPALAPPAVVGEPEPQTEEPVKLQPQPAIVTVTLNGVPSGATVRYNGEPVQGGEIRGPEGSDGVLEIEAEGFQALRAQVVLSRDMRFDVGARLEPIPRPERRPSKSHERAARPRPQPRPVETNDPEPPREPEDSKIQGEW